MKLKTDLLLPVAAALLCLMTVPAAADPVTSQDDENATLVRLIHELDALSPLIQEAESKALVDKRIRLNYGWLRRDIALVKDGIEWHLNTPSTEPRNVEPLKGDYRY
jgi:RAQPRD family integrative conjugative element protein